MSKNYFFINAGSSSVNGNLFNARRKGAAKGLIERIGLKDSISTVKFDGRSETPNLRYWSYTSCENFIRWFETIWNYSISMKSQVLGTVVAGGEYFKESVFVTDDVGKD